MFQRIQKMIHNPSDIIQKILFPFPPPIGSYVPFLFLLLLSNCLLCCAAIIHLLLLSSLSLFHVPSPPFFYSFIPFIHLFSPLISSLLFSHLFYLSVASSFFSPFPRNDRWAFGGFPAFLILFLGNGILLVACCHFLRECKFDISLSFSNILFLRQKD